MITKNLSLIGTLILSAIFTAACQNRQLKQEQELSQKVSQEPRADTPEEIAHRGAEVFVSSPKLTDDQKRKIMLIYSRVYADAVAIRKEIGQSKSLIFKMVASKKHNSPEIERLKARIVKLDQDRLQIMFKALRDVQDVVGFGPGKEEIYQHFYDYESPRNRPTMIQ